MTVPKHIDDRLKELETQSATPAPQPTEPQQPAEPQVPPADQPPAEPQPVTPAEPQQPNPGDEPAPAADGDVTTLPAWAQVHVAKLEADNRALRGKIRAEGPRNAQEIRDLRSLNMRLQQELAARDERIAQLAQQPQPAARTAASDDDPAKVAESVFTAEEREEMGSLAPMIAKGAKRIADKSIEQIRQDNERIQKRLFFGQLDGLCQQWRALNEDQGFLTWLNGADGLSGTPRSAILDAAVSASNAEKAADVFNAYLSETGKAAPAPAPANPRAPAAHPAPSPAQQVAPRKGGGAPVAAPAGRVFTVAEVNTIIRNIHAGRYTASDAKKLSDEIELAMDEGRVKP